MIATLNTIIEDNGVGFNELKDNIKNILNPYFHNQKKRNWFGIINR